MFPTANSSGADGAGGAKEPDLASNSGAVEEEEEATQGMDMSALLERIRARYKLTCSLLGVAPRETSGTSNSEGEEQEGVANPKARIGGKLVDPNQLRY